MIVQNVNVGFVDGMADRDSFTFPIGRIRNRIGRDNSGRLRLTEHVGELDRMSKFRSPSGRQVRRQNFAGRQDETKIVLQQIPSCGDVEVRKSIDTSSPIRRDDINYRYALIAYFPE